MAAIHAIVIRFDWLVDSTGIADIEQRFTPDRIQNPVFGDAAFFVFSKFLYTITAVTFR